MKIQLKEDYKPFAVKVARKLPIVYREKVKSLLDDMVQKEVIAPVGDKITEWIHPIVVVPKKNGEPRLTVDFTKLNSQVVRAVYPVKSPDQIIEASNPGSKLFSTIDCTHGY